MDCFVLKRFQDVSNMKWVVNTLLVTYHYNPKRQTIQSGCGHFPKGDLATISPFLERFGRFKWQTGGSEGCQDKWWTLNGCHLIMELCKWHIKLIIPTANAQKYSTLLYNLQIVQILCVVQIQAQRYQIKICLINVCV